MPQFRRLFPALLVLALAGMLAWAMVGCSGDDGATGPMGPQGPTGNANVIYSNWVTIPATARDTTVDGTMLKYKVLPATQLTQARLDSALVLVYMRVGTIGPYLLPYQSTAGGKDNTLGDILAVGKILIYRMTPSATTTAELIGMSSSIEYRYIIAPGNVLTSKAQEVIDWSDYASVKARFGLPD